MMPVEKELTQTRFLASRNDLWFWVLLVSGNVLFFLPHWIFLGPGGFSVNLEFTFALIILVGIGWSWRRGIRGVYWGFFLLFFYIAIIYKSYAGILQGVYQLEPNFYNDIPFITNGLPFLLSSLDVPRAFYVAFVIGVLLLFVFIGYLTHTLFVYRVETVGRITSMLMVSLGLAFMLYGGSGLKMNAELPKGVDSLSNEINLNLRASRVSRENVATFMAKDPYATYDYVRYPLAKKPNIYMIFFESYGSVLYKREHFHDTYTAMVTDIEERLEESGWYATSAFSEAPTWGGGSWMSYTSALFGVNVSEQSEYIALREAYQNIPYPNMGRYFHTQGYEYIWVVPINRELPPKYQEADYAFYGADRWVTFDTLNYDGPLYGWGPSPPDQYTLDFIQDLVRENVQPTFLFYLNQDSHYPWVPLPEQVDDSHKLAISDAEGGRLNAEEKREVSIFQARENYIAALAHSFENFADFITNLDDPSAIVILIGDHQPPTVSRHEDGFETMLHIISRDKNFLENFNPYGFRDGLLLENQESQIAHAGLYSLFVRNLLARYGSEPNNLPPYLEQGLN